MLVRDRVRSSGVIERYTCLVNEHLLSTPANHACCVDDKTREGMYLHLLCVLHKSTTAMSPPIFRQFCIFLLCPRRFAPPHTSPWLVFLSALPIPPPPSPRLPFSPISLVVARTQIATKAAWSVVFAQEMLVVSAILLALIAFTLFMAVVSLSKIQFEEGITPFTLPFWGVYFPIGLHGGWTLAGTRNLGRGTWGGEGRVVVLALYKGLVSEPRIIFDDAF